MPKPESNINFVGNKLVVATNFLYRNYLLTSEERDLSDTDGVRGDLALETINKATRLGVQIVASDGGSSSDFLSALEQYQGKGLTLVHSEIASRGFQRRRAFNTATSLPKVEAIVYIQPEKVSIIDYLTEITKPILENQADIVVPSRNPQLFKQTYPDYMRKSELRVNATYNWLMQKSGLITKDQSFDWFFGPVVFRNDPEIVDLFLQKYEITGIIKSRSGAEPSPENHSDGHFFPVIEALFNRKRVVGIEIPFIYPSIQMANEISPEKIGDFMKRRKVDADAYRLEAIHFLEYLKGNPNSKIRKD